MLSGTKKVAENGLPCTACAGRSGHPLAGQCLEVVGFKPIYTALRDLLLKLKNDLALFTATFLLENDVTTMP